MCLGVLLVWIYCWHIYVVISHDSSLVFMSNSLRWSCWGLYWFHFVCPSRLASCCGFVHTKRCPSIRPFVRPSRILCPLCSTYSSGWIHFIYIHLTEQLQKVFWTFLQNFKIRIFGNFFKICSFDFVLFWLCIWFESLVWVIMGRRGVSQNTVILVVLVED